MSIVPVVRPALIAATLSFALALLGGAPAYALPDFDGDGVLAPADCDPFDGAVAPGKPDRPDLGFEDTNCDGIDGDRARAIFVWRSGGDDVSPGTLTSPVETIGRAIALAAAANPVRDVYIISDTYPESVAAADGVGLYGGFLSTGSRSRAETTIIQGSPQAVLAEGDTSVVLQLLTLEGRPDAAGSAYGLRAVPGSAGNAGPSRLAISEVVARALAAGPGADGPQGATGDAGPDGQAGGPPTARCSPGAGGTGAGTAAGGNGGTGGEGGEGTATGGIAGESVTGSGATAGSAGLVTGGSRDGGPGGSGNPGAAGASAVAPTALPTGAAWTPVDGGVGTPGWPGGGGGGGAGGAGRSFTVGNDPPETVELCGGGGGGGGGGGHGGVPGGAGRGGGGSFAAYVFDSSLVAAAATLAGGAGGPGGNGRLGGLGGPGGRSGPQGPATCFAGRGCSDPGGNGGAGGQGGAGGPSGGGLGGPSAGVYQSGVGSGFAALPGTTIAHASGGIGGLRPGDGIRSASGPSGPRLRTAGAPDNSGADFDADGVADGQDACPDAARGAADANVDGCADRAARLTDRDGDGIPDGFDACPDQPRGAVDVNEDGCPDGVVVVDEPPITTTTSTGANTGAGTGTTAPPPPEAIRVVNPSFDAYSTWTRRTTRFSRFVVLNVAPATTLRLTCRGRGCPPKAYSRTFAKRMARVDLSSHLKRRALAVGTVLELWSTAPDARGTVQRFLIRKNKRPLVTQLCVPPGKTSRPQRC